MNSTELTVRISPKTGITYIHDEDGNSEVFMPKELESKTFSEILKQYHQKSEARNG